MSYLRLSNLHSKDKAAPGRKGSESPSVRRSGAGWAEWPGRGQQFHSAVLAFEAVCNFFQPNSPEPFVPTKVSEPHLYSFETTKITLQNTHTSDLQKSKNTESKPVMNCQCTGNTPCQRTRLRMQRKVADSKIQQSLL